MTVEAPEFRAALSRFASGVTILTLRDDAGRDHGMTVSAFSSLSLSPPLVLACVDESATMRDRFHVGATFAVHMLGADQSALSDRFADPDADRFDGLAVDRGFADVPLLPGAVARLQCVVDALLPGGDHTIVVGKVLDADVHDGDPLVYFRGRYRALADATRPGAGGPAT